MGMNAVKALYLPEMALDFHEKAQEGRIYQWHEITGGKEAEEAKILENRPPDQNRSPLEILTTLFKQRRMVDLIETTLDIIAQGNLSPEMQHDMLELAAEAFNFYDIPSTDRKRLYWPLKDLLEDEGIEFGIPELRFA